MLRRIAFAFTALLLLASVASADVILFKDGKKKTVRIYKTSKNYVSYLFAGRIEIVPRDTIKENGIQITGKPLTPKELAAALEAARKEMKQRVREEAKKNGVKPSRRPVKVVTDKSNGDAKGVKVVTKGASKTQATELIVDPFPDHPTEKETRRKK
jgi:hypothetical protein